MILVVGALASGLFIIDYMRTANLKLKAAKHIMITNFSICSVLTLAALSKLGLVGNMVMVMHLFLILMIIVDVALIYQFFLLREARRNDEHV